MEKYISKSALVAEIESKRNDYINSLMTEQVHVLNDVLDFLDTLEVKEVDLNTELSYEDYKGFFERYPDLSDDWGFEEAWTFAKHFFELGLKAQKGK